jgi:hypothetical protein
MDISPNEADWRLAAVARVRGDQAVHGKVIKDGTLLWLSTVTKDVDHGVVCFPTPSPAALALSVAVGAALSAAQRRKSIVYSFKMADGTRSAQGAEIAALYDYFEQCMLATVFSFQSLESYANQVISRLQKGPYTLQRKRETVTVSPEELERVASTDEKLAVILPALIGVPSPRSKKVWQRYKALKEVRDSTVHLKSQDQYVRGRVDRDSLYYRFLTLSAKGFPQAAIAMLDHFSSTGPERWLDYSRERLNTPDRAA